MTAQNWRSFQVSLPGSCLRQWLRTWLKGTFLGKRYPAYPHDSEARIVFTPLPLSYHGDVCVDVGGGDQGTFSCSCFLCTPLPSPGVQASLPGTRCPARGTGCQEKEKTILKYLSAHSLWKFRIMWLNRTCEINLLTSPRGRHEYFEWQGTHVPEGHC